MVKEFKGHSSLVNVIIDLEFMSQIASGSQDMKIIIWNFKTGSKLKVMTGHADQVWDLVSLNEPYHIASCAQDGTIRVWNFKEGICVSCTLKLGSPLYKMMRVENRIIGGMQDGKLISMEMHRSDSEIEFIMMRLSEYELMWLLSFS